MSKKEKKEEKSTSTGKKSLPFLNPQARENQLINLAMNIAESQLRDGSASSQIITHFLRLATTREQLENEKLRSDLKVAEAKIKQMESNEDIKELYDKAISALKSYGNYKEEEDYDDY